MSYLLPLPVRSVLREFMAVWWVISPPSSPYDCFVLTVRGARRYQFAAALRRATPGVWCWSVSNRPGSLNITIPQP